MITDISLDSYSSKYKRIDRTNFLFIRLNDFYDSENRDHKGNDAGRRRTHPRI